MFHLNIFQKLKPFKAMVLGDFLLDTYTTGKVRRISPEAPVPIMEALKHEARPGGAGNVVLCLAALGAEVMCVGRLGADSEGKKLKDLLEIQKVTHKDLRTEKGYMTPVKNRLIADSQQLMRVDRERITPLDSELEKSLVHSLEQEIPKVQVIAISDYGKGFLTSTLLASVIKIAKKAGVPVIVDPKGTNFAKYKGATLIKPNQQEAYTAAHLAETIPLKMVAATLFETAAPEKLLITRSEAGMSLFEKDGRQEDFPVLSKEVKDVTGAGDTVLATLCLGMASGLDMPSTLTLANVAAGVVIERLGCCQVTMDELMDRFEKTPKIEEILSSKMRSPVARTSESCFSTSKVTE